MNKKLLQIVLAIAVLGAAWYFYSSRLPRFGAGEKAPDFSLNLENGTQVKLSDFKGKFVLVQFWGSWCPPCRKENPGLSRLYELYHEKGLEVISIAVERNPAGWKKAIENDGINWPMHAMEPGDFSGPVSTLFNIHSIPSIFLVNAEGMIIAANPALEVLEKQLQEQLN